MLMKISEYRKTQFTEQSRPSTNTIKKWINNGIICGEIYDGMYFVKINQIKTVNPLVNKVLQQ